MALCPSCEYLLPDDRQATAARCPNCCDPLYEPPTRISRPARAGEASCIAHQGRESVGTCARCGNHLCEVCRTAWRGKVLCAACVDRLLRDWGDASEDVIAHTRQAVRSVCLGVAAWALGVTGLLLKPRFEATTVPPLAEVGLAILLFVISSLAAIAVGQAIAALRARGPRMVLATIGLALGGLYMGTLMTLFAGMLGSVLGLF